MNALWQIILQILWRLRPVQALEVNLHDVIQMGLDLFASDDGVDDLAQDASYRRTLAAALFDAHSKLDLLIYLRACEISGTKPAAKRFTPNYTHTHNSADLMALWRSFHRLVERFDTHEHLAHVRASRLRREPDTLLLRLAATLQSISPALRAMEADNLRLACANAHDDLARRSAAKAAGGVPAFARGPPPRDGARALARGPPASSKTCKTRNRNLAASCENTVPWTYMPTVPATLWPSLSRTTITKPPSGRSSIRKSDATPPSAMISRRACSASRRVLKRGRPLYWGITSRQFISEVEQGPSPATQPIIRSQPIRLDYLNERSRKSPEHTSLCFVTGETNTVRVLVMPAAQALAPER